MISCGREICSNLSVANRHEWLETNGIGGYASSTITGLNTRRYHGLLVAATQPPVGRYVLLSKLEETIIVDGHAYALSANRYPGVTHPQGFQFLEEFRLDPFPAFRYRVAGIEIEKSVFMVHGENTVVARYVARGEASPGSEFVLELRPLIAFRDYQSLTHENGAINPELQILPEWTAVAPYAGLPTLQFAHEPATVEQTGVWYRNFQYEAEQERGLDFEEDLFSPCVLRFQLGAAREVNVIASTQAHRAADATRCREAEIARRQAIGSRDPVEDEVVQQLAIAADQFIVARDSQHTVIAGYHWFSDWGRDTMIALPGLTLQAGRPEIARGILRTFAHAADRGMLPNRFPDAGDPPEYNTVDATLWFFEAIRAYCAATGDLAFVRKELYRVLTEIIAWHVRGTRYNIRLETSGLLHAGEPGVQLTWMDAKVGDWVVTPRTGYPVEIQALWYNALRIMEDLAKEIGDELGRRRYGTMAIVAKWSFNRRFWNEKDGGLYDVINGEIPDASLRPNQIFAVSLPHSMLHEERATRVVQTVQQHLLTPYGLRTLAPSDPKYRGTYSGDQRSRDGAYHQGTVWPWLLGPFITAYLRVRGHSDAARRQAELWLAPLRDHLLGPGLGQIPEIFEGDAPHRPVGCIAQAWSAGEMLRVMMQELRSPRSGDSQQPDVTAGKVAAIDLGIGQSKLSC